jgi:hypothetical protein
MGINVSSGGGTAVFYKINQKTGCLQSGTKENKVSYDAGSAGVEGTFVGFAIDDNEYEGVKSEAIRMIFRDVVPDQPRMHVSMTISSDGDSSAFGIRTLAKLISADFNDPVTLTPYLLPKGSPIPGTNEFYSVDVTGVSIKQNGKKLPETMGTPDNKLPVRPSVCKADGTPIILKGREQKDSSVWAPVLDGLLTKLSEKLAPVEKQTQTQTQAQGQSGASEFSDEGGHDTDGIDPEEMMAAAQAATSREAMRSRT